MILFPEYIYFHLVPFSEICHDLSGHLIFGKQFVIGSRLLFSVSRQLYLYSLQRVVTGCLIENVNHRPDKMVGAEVVFLP